MANFEMMMKSYNELVKKVHNPDHHSPDHL